MDRRTVDGLLAFFAVARQRSVPPRNSTFHNGAARGGARIGNAARLTPHRTQRRTDGRLMRRVGPRLDEIDEIDEELKVLTESREKTTAGEDATNVWLWPRLGTIVVRLSGHQARGRD
jgi:hypothetical protein